MAYSNGYDITAVYAALKDRIGFRQPVGSGVPTLTSTVTTTNSGRYFQDFHSLVTVQNIKSTMELVAASDAQLITYLDELRKAAIMRSLNGVFTGRQVIDQVKLFKRYGRNDQVQDNEGLFVGYMIDVADKPDIAVQIDALHVFLNGAPEFNVYVFADGNPDPIHTVSVPAVADKVTEIIPSTSIILNRGKYYIGYFQNDLGGVKAYREQVECWNSSHLFGYSAIAAESTGATTFNREEISYTEPYGLNVEISSFIDHTRQIKIKPATFDELIGLTLSYMVIEQIIYAVRSNKDERILKDQIDKLGIQLDLTGSAPVSESPQIMGLRQRIERETKTVKQSFYPKPKAQTISIC